MSNLFHSFGVGTNDPIVFFYELPSLPTHVQCTCTLTHYSVNNTNHTQTWLNKRTFNHWTILNYSTFALRMYVEVDNEACHRKYAIEMYWNMHNKCSEKNYRADFVGVNVVRTGA